MRVVAGLVLLLIGFAAAQTANALTTVQLAPSRDNTLYESTNQFGPPSGGAIDGVFTGTAGDGGERRALLAFDIAGLVPAGATITAASLTLTAQDFSTHPTSSVGAFRLLADWGEGTSTADFGAGGGGAGGAPTIGGATWFHTFFATGSWTNAGGDFAATASSTAMVSSTGTATWTGLAGDVQLFLDQPGQNFGWGLIEETGLAAAHRLISREGGEAGMGGPSLSITYVPEPSAGLLLTLGFVALRRR